MPGAACQSPGRPCRQPGRMVACLVRIKDAFRARLAALELKIGVLYACWRDPDTPWYARAMIFLVLAYAVSPIDLIPDFIPLLGQLDDLLLVPLGIMAAVRLIPKPVWERHLAAAAARVDDPALRRTGLIAVGLAWLLTLVLIIKFLLA